MGDSAHHIEFEKITLPLKVVGKVYWNLKSGEIVRSGQNLGYVEESSGVNIGRKHFLISPLGGKLNLVVENNQEIDEAVNHLATIEFCSHPVKKGNLCMFCFEMIDDDGRDDSVNVVFSDGKLLRISVNEAKQLDFANITRQLRDKKLSLVLDLDHTLLHATQSEKAANIKADELHTIFLPRPGGMRSRHFVKLRPDLRSFLQKLAGMYDLHVYTHATRQYAEEIVKILDPLGHLFRNRIVSRTDTPDNPHKYLKFLFPSCDDSMILVLDDRVDVWRDNAQNVVLVDPYHFFHGMEDVNNSAGPGITKLYDEETTIQENDNQLESMFQLFKTIHTKFFSSNCAKNATDQLEGRGNDVKNLLGQIQKSVLKGCHLVFSGLIRTDQNNPERHELWRMAKSFGARVSLDLTDGQITHLVLHPDREGTEKHRKAMLMKNVFIVKPKWLIDSVRQWRKCLEKNYSFGDQQQLLKAAGVAPSSEAPSSEAPGSEAPGSEAVSVSASAASLSSSLNDTTKEEEEQREEDGGSKQQHPQQHPQQQQPQEQPQQQLDVNQLKEKDLQPMKDIFPVEEKNNNQDGDNKDLLMQVSKDHGSDISSGETTPKKDTTSPQSPLSSVIPPVRLYKRPSVRRRGMISKNHDRKLDDVVGKQNREDPNPVIDDFKKDQVDPNKQNHVISSSSLSFLESIASSATTRKLPKRKTIVENHPHISHRKVQSLKDDDTLLAQLIQAEELSAKKYKKTTTESKSNTTQDRGDGSIDSDDEELIMSVENSFHNSNPKKSTNSIAEQRKFLLESMATDIKLMKKKSNHSVRNNKINMEEDEELNQVNDDEDDLDAKEDWS